MKKQLSPGEQLFYILANICSLGTPFLLKAIIKKAMIEAQPDPLVVTASQSEVVRANKHL